MPKEADITFQNDRFLLKGHLDFSNVMSVYQKSMQYMDHCHALLFDFSAVKDSNSAGLALIIEWIKWSKKCNKRIQFAAISQDLMAIAKIAGLDQLLLLDS